MVNIFLKYKVTLLTSVCLALMSSASYAEATKDERSDGGLSQALESGDVKHIDNVNVLLDEIIRETSIHYSDDLNNAKIQIFNLNEDGSVKAGGESLTDITWRPNKEASLNGASIEAHKVEPLLIANGTNDDSMSILGNIGQSQNSYFIQFADNPMTSKGGNYANDNMESVFINSIEWLTNREKLSGLKVTIVQASAYPTNQDYREITRYFNQYSQEHFSDDPITYNKDYACDGGLLMQCVEKDQSELIVLFGGNYGRSAEAFEKHIESLKAAQAQGVPILYLTSGNIDSSKHTTNQVMGLSRKAMVHSRDAYLTDYTPELSSLGEAFPDINAFAHHLQNSSFSFDVSTCSGTKCGDPLYTSGFWSPLMSMRSDLQQIDKRNEDPFSNESENIKLVRLLILLGDWYRQTVHYPMPKKSTSKAAITESLVADALSFLSRNLNHAQPDTGNFNSTSTLSDTQKQNVNVTLTTDTTFNSSGYYALPGHTVRITRTDNNSGVDTHVYLNRQRTGATKEWSNYRRPKFLQSVSLPIAIGDSVEFTDALGGILFVDANKDKEQVAFKLENISQHPTFKAGDDTELFKEELEKNTYNWAEVLTPYFEWHVRSDLMRNVFNDPRYTDDLNTFVEDTNHYMHSYPRALAGFEGEGVIELPEVTAFAKKKGWSMKQRNTSQHLYSDQPNCGGGCSGNPIDTGWTPNPTSHGHIHEVGHGLETSRLVFEPITTSHAVTNLYAYYSQNQYNQNHPDAVIGCNDVSSYYFQWKSWVQEAYESELGFAAAMREKFSVEGGKLNAEANIFLLVQFAAAAEHQTSSDDGWSTLAKLHLYMNEYEKAKGSESTWNTHKHSLGLEMFSYQEGRALAKNDLLLAGFSTVIEMNAIPMFEYLGVTFSEYMANQVSSYGFMPMQDGIYQLLGNNSLCQAPYFVRVQSYFEPLSNNVAYGKPVTVSDYRGSYYPENLVNNRNDKIYAAENMSQPMWAKVDLEDQFDIGRISLVAHYKGDHTSLNNTRVTLLGADDNVLWETVLDLDYTDTIQDYEYNLRVPSSIKNVRYIKVSKPASSNSSSENRLVVSELQAYTKR